MEAAALFTVAAHRGVALASAFCVSDSLATPSGTRFSTIRILAHILLALYGAASTRWPHHHQLEQQRCSS